MATIVRFGSFEADLKAAELRKEGKTIPLQREPFYVLRLLVSDAGEVITRQHLQESLWTGSTHVEFDHCLNTAIVKLRKALGDKVDFPRYIETVHGIGYRFLMPVEFITRSKSRYLLAVLPFRCLSQEPEQEYFCDGLTEDVISELGKVDPVRLGVIAKTSSWTYKDSDMSADQIARELKADLVLEGSLRKEEGRIRVSIRLIDAGDQTQIWADSYDRELTGVLDVQREIAQEAVNKTGKTLDLSVKKSQVLSYRPNSQAYEAYLKGRYHLQKLTRQSLLRSAGLFEQAISKDADFALAYAALGESYNLLQFCGTPFEGLASLAKEAALKALEMDDTLASAHNSLAGGLLFYEWDWVGAERAFKAGLKLNPSLAEGHRDYAILLSALGRHVEAIREAEEALRLDPVSMISNTNLAWRFFRARRYDDAIRQTKRTLELESEFSNTIWCLGKSLIQNGTPEEGLAFLQKAVQNSPENALFKADLAIAYGILKMPEEALNILSVLRSAQSEGYVSPYALAWASLTVEDPEKTLQYLEEAFDQKDPYLIWVNEEVYFDHLRADSRFRQLIKRMRFPPKESLSRSDDDSHLRLPPLL